MVGLIKKLADWPIAEQDIRLGGRAKLRMLGGRRTESEESPADAKRSKMAMPY